MNVDDTNSNMDMAQRHREMIMGVARTISTELTEAGSQFAMTPGDVLRIAATPISDQEEILAKYLGEEMAASITQVATQVGAKTVAEALDRENRKREGIDLEESLKDMVNRVMDNRGPLVKIEQAEDDGCDECKHEYTELEEFEDNIQIGHLFAKLLVAGRTIFLTKDLISSEDDNPKGYYLTQFNDDDMVDQDHLGSDQSEALNMFTAESMLILMEEKANQAVAIELDRQQHEENTSIDINITSVVTDVMTKLFSGGFQRKAS